MKRKIEEVGKDVQDGEATSPTKPKVEETTPSSTNTTTTTTVKATPPTESNPAESGTKSTATTTEKENSSPGAVAGGDDKHVDRTSTAVVAGGDDKHVDRTSTAVVAGGDDKHVDRTSTAVAGGDDKHVDRTSTAVVAGGGGGEKPKEVLSIVFVTGNVGKLREVIAILNENSENKEIPRIPLTNKIVDLPELQGSPKSISSEKCRLAVESIKGPCVVEDTCLCFNALEGLPGPYIKWFLDAIGKEGLNKMLTGFEDKTGYALAIFSFSAGPGQPIHTFEGRVDGKIVFPRGQEGFGWDPIFEPNESNGKTFAELTKEEKNTISHRRRALEKLKQFLLENKSLWMESSNK